MVNEINLENGEVLTIKGGRLFADEYDTIDLKREDDKYFILMDNGTYGPFTSVFAHPYKGRYSCVVGYDEERESYDLFKSLQGSWEHDEGFASTLLLTASDKEGIKAYREAKPSSCSQLPCKDLNKS